ncbi:hypothetical protein A5893_00995 [Pedobacter psychrophilus]|uniref:Uncharacterized protein n=1 Tax=Pedobacter psychrophilus TaxID=1826909 RepID=A0A179DLV6_9SPHI|nr:hypothetical protein [Pedobacter psychrophilus]OAQ41720.1 hypothetical protein A5893_00995 [Pedobacter psychrophilus]
MENLVGTPPEQMLLHGSTKRLLDNYHWHQPKVGIIASYTPKTRDVEDHFGLFRGVDQIEAFAQATIVSCATFLECQKNNLTPLQLKDKFIPAFISVGNVNFHDYLQEGETFISIGKIKFYKFRQMVADGRIYKVPKGLDLNEYFKNFDESKLENYALSDDFILVAELFDIIGRALKKEIFNKL